MQFITRRVDGPSLLVNYTFHYWLAHELNEAAKKVKWFKLIEARLILILVRQMRQCLRAEFDWKRVDEASYLEVFVLIKVWSNRFQSKNVYEHLCLEFFLEGIFSRNMLASLKSPMIFKNLIWSIFSGLGSLPITGKQSQKQSSSSLKLISL